MSLGDWSESQGVVPSMFAVFMSQKQPVVDVGKRVWMYITLYYILYMLDIQLGYLSQGPRLDVCFDLKNRNGFVS